jgi:hypothetical protein
MCNSRNNTEQIGVAVTLYIRIREVLASNLGQDIGYPGCFIMVLHQSLQANAEIA